MADALALVPSDKPVVAYDLGAGIGRHTIPLLRELPAGSDVFAVDLLPSALRSLENAVPPGIRTHLHTRPADLDDFEFEEVDDHGRRRPALLESAMSTADATGLLASAFGGFDMTYQRLGPAQVREDIYTLTSTLVTWLATRPEKSGETELR